MALHVGVIGYGAVAQDALRTLAAHAPVPRITVLLRASSQNRAAIPAGVAVVQNVEDLLAGNPDLVLEAAGHDAVAALVPDILVAGIPVLVVSTGAFAEPGLLDRMSALARTHGTRLLLSAGAIGGLDYLEAAALGQNLRVRYTSRKPPAAWRLELAALQLGTAALSCETVLFEGSAEEAARLYPRNLNVALTLRCRLGTTAALIVRVVADPRVQQNIHEIEAEGSLGRVCLQFANRPSPDNPKTSALTGHMVAAEIKRALVDSEARRVGLLPRLGRRCRSTTFEDS